MPAVLHLLAQRPGRTGSGVTLDALVRGAAAAGWDQHVVIGVPAEDSSPSVGQLPAERIHPLVFERGELDFPVPGMSDVMPYRSTRFSSMTPAQLGRYRSAWRKHVAAVVAEARPSVIHTHHVWILSSLLADLAPDIPVVNHCHATGLRQMEICGHLAAEVTRGCRRNARFAVLHRGHAAALGDALGVEPDRIDIVGAGYRDDLFHDRNRRTPFAPALLYAGKYSHAKGLPWLLDAVERLAAKRPGLVLHVAGTGDGDESDALRRRMERMHPVVQLHGQVSQAQLASLARRAAVFVLPSFYEGLPLVLVEAAASGCRLVCTKLPGVVDALAEPLAPVLDLVDLPRMRGVDVPVDEDLPVFVDNLAAALETALDASPPNETASMVRSFTWRAVFERIDRIWRRLVVRG